MTIKEFVKSIDKSYRVKQGDAFYCECYDGVIYYNTDEFADTEYTRLFNEFIVELADGETLPEISDFTWALLHEIGHCETCWDVDDKMEYATTKFFAKNENKVDTTKAKREYMRLPKERCATEWAVEFVLENEEMVKEFDKSVVLGF